MVSGGPERQTDKPVFYEELDSAASVSRVLADHLCVRCARPVQHIFRATGDNCLLCRRPLIEHDGLPQGDVGFIHHIRRDGDESRLVYMWCRACAVICTAEWAAWEWIAALFAAVPEAVRCNEVITAGILTRFKN